MKCTWCRESIRESKDGWTADGLIHCENSKNGKHEPEPTEAAPSTEPLVAHIAGVIADALHNTDPLYRTREAVVGGQPPKDEDYWIAACLHIILCEKSYCSLCNHLKAEIEKEHPNVRAAE